MQALLDFLKSLFTRKRREEVPVYNTSTSFNRRLETISSQRRVPTFQPLRPLVEIETAQPFNPAAVTEEEPAAYSAPINRSAPQSSAAPRGGVPANPGAGRSGLPVDPSRVPTAAPASATAALPPTAKLALPPAGFKPVEPPAPRALPAPGAASAPIKKVEPAAPLALAAPTSNPEADMRAQSKLQQPECLILVDRDIKLDPELIFSQIRGEVTKHFESCQPGPMSGESIIVTAGRHMFEIRYIPGRGIDQSIETIRSGIQPNVEMILTVYRGQIMVKPWGPGQYNDAFAYERCVLLSLISSRIGLLHKAVGFYWSSAGFLHSAESFHMAVADMMQKRPRFDMMIKSYPVKGEPNAQGHSRVGIVTRGLRCLDRREIELLPTATTAEKAHEQVMKIAAHLLANPNGAKEGQTIGSDHDRVTVSPKEQGHYMSGPVYQLTPAAVSSLAA
jgi:hypothetical protein